jgi:hypothetical protein
MRFLIANLLHPDQAIDFGNLHRWIVDPDVTVKRDIDRAPRPRIIKSHGSFDPRYRRVIYLVRDPRAVVLSQYSHLRELRAIDSQTSIEEFGEKFVTGDLNRLVGSWGENVGSWLATRSRHPGFLLLRYEEMLANTAHELLKVADFLGFRATPEIIAQAIARSSADKMWEGRKKQGESYLPVQPSTSRWRNELPKALAARIERAWGDMMACLGYALSAEDAGRTERHSLIESLMAESADAHHREEVFATDIPGIVNSMSQRTAIH